MTRIWNLPLIDELPLADVHESRAVALVTLPTVWNVVHDKLRLPIVWRAEPTGTTLEVWDAFSVPHGNVIYAVGGRSTIETAKYLAHKFGLPLVAIPTALDSDTYLTPTAARIETLPPDRIILDWDILASAPEHLRAAGIADVLSIATATWDWRFAHEQGKNSPDTPYNSSIDGMAKAILQGVFDCAEAAGRGDIAGLKQLFHLLALKVQLTNLIGHTRPTHGSEHHFAYALANSGFAQDTNTLTAGILQIARLQGQDTSRIETALRAAKIRVDAVSDDTLQSLVRDLPAFVRLHDLPFGIAHTLTL